MGAIFGKFSLQAVCFTGKRQTRGGVFLDLSKARDGRSRGGLCGALLGRATQDNEMRGVEK